MKTLYININGENTQSTENITVVGKPEDAIINKFYYELVKGIVKGVTVPGIGEVKKRSLVTDFEANNKEAFAKITEQWELAKQVLLGENPTGTKTIVLPEEYINWLKFHSNPVYNEIAKSLANRGSVVEISIEKIYKNAIGLLVNNIDLKKKYDSFTVNDEIVDDDSAISVDIRKKIGESVPFVPFEEWEGEQDWNKLFPVCGMMLGETNIHNVTTNQQDISEYENCFVYELHGIHFMQRIEDSFISLVYIHKNNGEFPKNWEKILGFSFNSSIKTVSAEMTSKGMKIIHSYSAFLDDNDFWIVATPDDKYIIRLLFDEDGLESIAFLLGKCPYCGTNDVFVSNQGYITCPNCNHKGGWFVKKEKGEDKDAVLCPKCGSDDITVTDYGNGFLQYICNDCGREWGNRDDIECPECGSDNVTDDGSGYMQYKCNICGHTWGNENDEDQEDYADELHKFFPVMNNIILGETTFEELIDHGLCDEVYYYDETGTQIDSFNRRGRTVVWYDKVHIEFWKNRDVITEVKIFETDRSLFPKWEQLGFDWDLSYNEWIELFKARRYTIRVYIETHSEMNSYGHSDNGRCLKAAFIAISPDDSITFNLVFDCGHGDKRHSKRTLDSIEAEIR